MTKAAFDKIKAGIDDARRYLDGSIDRGEVPALTDSKVSPTSAQAQAQPPEKAP